MIRFAILLISAMSCTFASQYILTRSYLGTPLCEGNYTSSSVIVADCNLFLGDFGSRRYGHVIGENTTHYFVEQCADSACQINCSLAYSVQTGCIGVSNPTPPYPQEARYVAIINTLPQIPPDYTVEYQYTQPGCDERYLGGIYTYDHVCRTVLGQSSGRFCNATTASLTQTCDGSGPVSSTPTGTCLPLGSDRSYQTICQLGTSCSNNNDCTPLSEDYNFVECQSRTCSCKAGFSGSASSTDKCRCDGTVVYNNGVPSCLSSGQCTSDRRDLCSGFTTDYNFINCVSGKCQCQTGFQGSATTSDKCRCNGTLNWVDGVPTCTTA